MNHRIQPRPLPAEAVLQGYRERGAYTDAYSADVPGAVTLARYVEAFYTTPVFRTERLILRLAVARPSTDAEARQLARGETDRFAAWSVEDRDRSQLLLCDFRGTTRSWLMVQPLADGAGTRLWFGSAVVPTARSVQEGRPRMGFAFRALLGFHQLYSRVLLAAAVRRLAAGGRA